MSAQIDLIAKRLLLSDVIAKDTVLTKHGDEYIGKCPFHIENTPSFYVNNVKCTYYCFGCHAKGNMFTYCMQKYGLTFLEALALLSDRAGVPRLQPRQQKTSIDPHAVLYEICQEVAQLCHNHLFLQESYLRKRGVTTETADQFMLGFVPDKDHGFFDALRQQYTEDALIRSGVLIEKNGRIWHWMRNRLIFPIRDHKGMTVGFGGRLVGEGRPKYLNSPETAIFHKKELLYGYYESLPHANASTPHIVVEGYMDVLQLHQNGLQTAVAPLGTAVSMLQLEKLWTTHGTPLFCFDGDKAGQSAMTKTVEMCMPYLKSDRSLNFVLLPQGEDPDSYVQKSAVQFQQCIKTALPCVEYLWRMLRPAFNLRIPEQVLRFKEHIKHICQTISDASLAKLYQQHLFDKIWHETRQSHRTEKKFLEMLDTSIKNRILQTILLAIPINHPILLDEVHESLGRVHFQDADLEQWRCALLEAYHQSTLEHMQYTLPLGDMERSFMCTKIDEAKSIWFEAWSSLFGTPCVQRHWKANEWEQVKFLKSTLISEECK